MNKAVDCLTGGVNEQEFIRLFEQRMAGKNVPCTLLCINIKGFRFINESHGRQTADWILKRIYHIFDEQRKPDEVLSRIDADTYLLLLNAATREQAEQRILQLNAGVAACKQLEQIQSVFFSIGCYIITDAEETYAHAVRCAHYSRVNSADFADENTSYELYQYTIKDTHHRSKELMNKCRHALEQGHFEVYLQPKYELEQETIVGAEALIRWNDPVEGMVPLGEFMPSFEQSGFIRRIDYFVFEQVLLFLQQRLDKGLPVVPISVNLAKSNFSVIDFFSKHFLPIFQRYHVPADLIEFEFSESMMAEDSPQVWQVLELCAEYGFACSLDDFGSGYSSLNTLKSVPVSTLKLDKRMFSREHKERGKIVIKGILDIAKGLGMQVVSEGVETREYVDFLKENHGGLVQGYYFSPPVPMSEFEQLLL